MENCTRRRFAATAAGFAVGVFAAPLLRVSAQEGTAADEIVPLGFVSVRVRTTESDEQRDIVSDMVMKTFIPEVQALEGYEGYVLGDVIDQPGASLSVLVLDNESQQAAFDELAKGFVASIEDDVSTVDTVGWSGDLLMVASGREHGTGTPAASAGAGPLTNGYVAVRVHTSLPGTDPREFVPLAQSGFIPIVAALDGFRGYLWFPTDEGFVAISLFDSQEAAEESNAAAKDWATEFLPEYTDGNPEIINATIRVALLPVLRK